MYTDSQRAVQDSNDSRRLADRIKERLVTDALDAEDKEFIAQQIMFFLATVDGSGQPQCSFKGGAAGFVRVIDSKTLAFPDYDGNGMYLSMGNVLETRQVGMLFVDFFKPNRLRVNGEASFSTTDPLLSGYPGARSIVRVAVREVFPNCSRYIPRLALVEESRFVPKADEQAPQPDWKQSDWACDVLPQEPAQ